MTLTCFLSYLLLLERFHVAILDETKACYRKLSELVADFVAFISSKFKSFMKFIIKNI